MMDSKKQTIVAKSSRVALVTLISENAHFEAEARFSQEEKIAEEAVVNKESGATIIAVWKLDMIP